MFQANRANHAASDARQQADRADTVRDLVFDIFSEAEPGGPKRGEVTVRQAIEKALTNLGKDTTTPPAIRLDLTARLATTLGRQGDAAKAEEVLTHALTEAEDKLGANHVISWDIGERLSGYQIERGNYAAARERLDRLLTRAANGPPRLRLSLLERSAAVAWRMHDKERALRDAGSGARAWRIVAERGRRTRSAAHDRSRLPRRESG